MSSENDFGYFILPRRPVLFTGTKVGTLILAQRASRSARTEVRDPVDVLVLSTENALLAALAQNASPPPWSHLQSATIGTLVNGEPVKGVSAPVVESISKPSIAETALFVSSPKL